MQFRCKECFHTFSVTSGTIFASHKKPLKIYLLAIALFTNAVKSISALQLSRDLDVQYKTAWVLSHKIRESLMDYNEDEKFEGTCEMDGVYVGHYIRPKNQIDKRVDRRKVHKPNKRVVISLRQRAELSDETVGAIKTKTFILKSENSNEIKEIAHKYIKVGSSIHADESNAYDDLTAHYDMNRVNHQVEYSGVYGENNNQSESFNARFRRMQYGNLHKIGNLYLSNYANEIAYREDTRRKSNKEIFDDILEKCLSSLVSNEFCGYWQGNKRLAERLGV
ncbi:IS1595 family transposase [Arcobacter sp. CECT 8985]|uniref:IS1595 family transposase n=1 Tax=Arcobacter sp. CECT 8985 TaxID=1935424 RepID=UPI002159DE96|nr:IS1595 family transposase [Arcobacter sp. CECT 8985]